MSPAEGGKRKNCYGQAGRQTLEKQFSCDSLLTQLTPKVSYSVIDQRAQHCKTKVSKPWMKYYLLLPLRSLPGNNNEAEFFFRCPILHHRYPVAELPLVHPRERVRP